MPRRSVDPLQAIQEAARGYPQVEEGTSCSQSSFKSNGKAFLYAGMQGGRCKLMLKLQTSLDEFNQRATTQPDDFEVGKNGWVTVRFSDEKPLPKKLWKKWLDESYQLCGPPASPQRKVAAKKKATRSNKKTSKKKTTRKKPAARKTT